MLLRACSSATDSEYLVKSHGDCVFVFETRGSTTSSSSDSSPDSDSDSDCDEDGDSGCSCSDSESDSCSESSISSSLGGSKMKLGDIVDSGKWRIEVG